MKTRMGCVRFRRGCWELDFRDVLGKRRQEKCRDLRKEETRQRKEAEARLYKRLEEVKAGSYQAPSEHLTVDEVVSSFLNNHVGPGGVEPETLKEYERIAALYITPHIGSLIARDVKRVQIEAWRAKLLASPAQRQRRRATREQPELATRLLSPRTVAKAMERLSAAYEYAMGHEWVLRNPTIGVKRPTKRSTSGSQLALAQSNALTLEEMNRLLTHAGPVDPAARRSGPWKLMIKFAAYTGMREAEICGLSWDDVDFNSNTAFVRKTWRKGRFKVPKTAHSVRRVEYPSSMSKELKEWKLACPKGEHQLVFPTETGGPQNPANLLHRGLYPALRRADLRKIRFHDLRHTFASLTLAGGENLGPVSRQLGHANTAVTLNVYRHVLPGEG